MTVQNQNWPVQSQVCRSFGTVLIFPGARIVFNPQRLDMWCVLRVETTRAPSRQWEFQIRTLRKLHENVPFEAGLREQSRPPFCWISPGLGRLLLETSQLREHRSEEHTSELQSLRHLVC